MIIVPSPYIYGSPYCPQSPYVSVLLGRRSWRILLYCSTPVPIYVSSNVLLPITICVSTALPPSLHIHNVCYFTVLSPVSIFGNLYCHVPVSTYVSTVLLPVCIYSSLYCFVADLHILSIAVATALSRLSILYNLKAQSNGRRRSSTHDEGVRQCAVPDISQTATIQKSKSSFQVSSFFLPIITSKTHLKPTITTECLAFL